MGSLRANHKAVLRGLFAFLLAMACSMLIPAVSQAKSVKETGTWGGASYSVYDDGSATVTGKFSSSAPDQAPEALRTCTTLDMSGVDTSLVTDMGDMFKGCSSLTDISGVASWDTSNVTSMEGTFCGCAALSDIGALANWNVGSVKSFGTSIRNDSGMFGGCESLANVDALASWNTSSATDMSWMFKGCSSLTDISGLSDWDTSNVTSMESTFCGCSSLSDIGALANWNVGSVKSFGMDYRTSPGMFSGCSSLVSLNALASWNTSSATRMGGIFSKCSSLTDISALASWDTSNVASMSYAFYGCSSLANVDGLASWDTSNVTSVQGMFCRCAALSDIGALANWNVGSVKFFGNRNRIDDGAFSNCRSITNIDALASWDMNSATDIGAMFYGCTSLTNVDDLASWDTSNVTSMMAVFRGCSNLTDISGLSSWDTSNVTSLSGMFSGCSSLANADDLASWDTSNVTDMSLVFSGCSNLTDLSMENWDTSKVTKTTSMLNCKNLSSITIGPKVTADVVQRLRSPSSTSPYTGKWVREDGSYGPYTVSELASNWNGQTMAGRWVWEIASHTVSFDPNGGTGMMAQIKTSPSTAVPASAFTHLGYAFTGWNDKADGTGTSYAVGDKLAPASDVTLYAQWKQEAYTVTVPARISHAGMDVGKVDVSDSYGVTVSGEVGTGSVEVKAGVDRQPGSGLSLSVAQGKTVWTPAEADAGITSTDTVRCTGVVRDVGPHEGTVAYTSRLAGANE